VRSLASEFGALLVFDETITGFRYHIGGAQAYFGVTPDLATFGKGIANGYPLSALVGRACYMMRVEEIFFSGTFGGETLSLAAGKAVLKKLASEPVIETLAVRGQQIVDGVKEIVARIGLSKQIGISGHPSWSFLQFRESSPYSVWQIKTLFIQEVFKRGVYTLGTHNLSYAHSDEDVKILLACYEEVFAIIANCLSKQNLQYYLECEPLAPLFKLR
jgi:glutamate-1-semialdehyde aminotransferase